MFIIQSTYFSQLEIKKSNFIAYITPIEDFKSLHVKLKEEHPKANHIVWAMRYFNEYEQVVENCSDDGEPKGTSGPPILNVMRGAALIECGILVVRYFGGTKLGTGGLVRAYGTSAKEVIDTASLVAYVKKKLWKFYVPFHLLSRFEHFFDTSGFGNPQKNFNETGVICEINLSEEEGAKFLDFAHVFDMEGFKVL